MNCTHVHKRLVVTPHPQKMSEKHHVICYEEHAGTGNVVDGKDLHNTIYLGVLSIKLVAKYAQWKRSVSIKH